MSSAGVVFDIKRYAVHDGPGLRTTVHLKGCPLSCWWCHNPEGIAPSPSILFRAERCVGCGKCAVSCPAGAIASANGPASASLCAGCGVCADICPSGARELCGRKMSIDELMLELRKDEIFFRGGGVTFSGGEPLMQPDFLIAALRACGREGYHRAVDTSGFVGSGLLLTAAEHTDLFLYDLKHMDTEKHRLYTGAGNELILENLTLLAEAGAQINIRVPFMPGINDGDENIAALADFVSKLKGVTTVSLLPYHSAAKGKHDRWGIEYKLTGLLPPSEEQLKRAADIIGRYGLAAHMGG